MAMFVMDYVDREVMSAGGLPGRPRPDPKPYLRNATHLLAEAVVERKQIDQERVGRVFREASEHMLAAEKRHREDGGSSARHDMLQWGGFITALNDFMQGGVIPMPDGRVATPGAWDYSNCEPERISAVIPRALCERLEAHIRTLTDAEGSLNPERNPDEFDVLYDKAVTQALAEYLDRLEAAE